MTPELWMLEVRARLESMREAARVVRELRAAPGRHAGRRAVRRAIATLLLRAARRLDATALADAGVDVAPAAP